MKAILITSSILILLIAALRPLLRGRIDPRIQYALWLAAALRLLLPGSLFTSAYSALALLERADRGAEIVETIGQTSIPAQSYDSARAQVVEEYRRQGVPEAQLTPSDLMAIDTQARALMRGPTLAELAAKYARPVWLGGAALMALWFAAVNWKLRRQLRDARRIEADCPLPVYVTDALPSPCLCGALRPRIYVTPAALDGPDRLRHVLAHELTHYRHRDPWWALMRCACLCLYWFDPLVWWAAALSRRDCELACDEGAIRALGEAERIPYGRTLVGMIAAGRTSLLQTATTMTGGKRRVRERVRLIARRPKTVIALALAAALLVGCAVGCTFSGAPETPLDAQREPQLLDLPSRLNDLPEELGAKVSTQDTESGALATYRLTVPADWEDERFADILSVCSFQKEGFRGWPAGGEDCLWEMAAQSDTRYYAVRRWREELYPSGYEFWDIHRDVRAFVEKTLLETEGVEPYTPDQTAPPQQAIQAVMNEIAAAPGTSFMLTIPPAAGGSALPYSYRLDTPLNEYWGGHVCLFADGFRWKMLTTLPDNWNTGEELIIQPDGSLRCIWAWSGSNIVAIRTPDNRMEYYEAKELPVGGDNAPFGTSILNPNPYQVLRDWFDRVELAAHRVTTVPDRGQSHEDIAREWALNYESALTKAAPGGHFSCTFLRVDSVQVDLPQGLTLEELKSLVESRNFSFAVEDFGKLWFGFSYELVFVPENQMARESMMAGNTSDYEGGDAPEGAMTYSRRGFLWRTDEGWTCREVGTGW